MDTKSTKNKVYKEVTILIIILLIIFFSISMTRAIRICKQFYSIYEYNFYDGKYILDNIDNFDVLLIGYLSRFDNLDGDVKQEVYNNEAENRKLQIEESLKKSEQNIREIWESNGFTEEETESRIEKAKEDIMYEDDNTYLSSYFNNIRMNYINNINSMKNIEFFLEDNTGAKITNIKDKDIEKKIENNDFYDEEYYHIYLPSSISINQEEFYSKNLSKVHLRLSNNNDSESEITRYYRIPKTLKNGDRIYDEFREREEVSSILNREIVITSVLGVLILVFAFIIYKNRKNNYTTYIEDLLIKIPIDIRAIIFVYSFTVLNSLIFNVIPYYGNNNYSNGIILKSVVLIILDYYFLKDLILILENKRSIEKVLTLKIYEYLLNIIKNNEFTKTNKFKFIFIICLSVLALICLWVESFSYLSYSIMIFSKAYLFIYLILASFLSVIIFKEISILEFNTSRIAKGNYKDDLNGGKILILKNIENNLITIEDGLKEALDKAITSEKMKSELITNVSHDLKTPLTSIINYISLLKEENITDEKRCKYLEVLDMKSKRLKILIEDLFEASKAVSGNMTFEKEDLNIVSLLRQVIGELEEKIAQANLNIITKWPEEKAILYLDGRKTFRVYENLINNIIKYSMKNSRVYIDVINSENEVIVIMKNISSYQIDFNSEEIIERFKRGDKARSTEGSGLGLSIAKSIVQLQGGKFDIEIDGDLFKVITTFQK